MLEHPRRVVTRDELRRRLWNDGTHVDFEHSLNAAIRRLRMALGDRPTSVETVPRLGYRFIAPAQNPGGEPQTTRENALPVPRLVVDVCFTARVVYAISEPSTS